MFIMHLILIDELHIFTFTRPYQRSLLYSMDTKLSLILDKLKPVGFDENLKVYALEDGIIIGIWRVNLSDTCRQCQWHQYNIPWLHYRNQQYFSYLACFFLIDIIVCKVQRENLQIIDNLLCNSLSYSIICVL